MSSPAISEYPALSPKWSRTAVPHSARCCFSRTIMCATSTGRIGPTGKRREARYVVQTLAIAMKKLFFSPWVEVRSPATIPAASVSMELDKSPDVIQPRTCGSTQVYTQEIEYWQGVSMPILNQRNQTQRQQRGGNS